MRHWTQPPRMFGQYSRWCALLCLPTIWSQFKSFSYLILQLGCCVSLHPWVCAGDKTISFSNLCQWCLQHLHSFFFLSRWKRRRKTVNTVCKTNVGTQLKQRSEVLRAVTHMFHRRAVVLFWMILEIVAQLLSVFASHFSLELCFLA